MSIKKIREQNIRTMKKAFLLITSLFLLTLTSCLDEQETQQAMESSAEIEVTFINEETEEPVPNLTVLMFVEADAFTGAAGIGEFDTDEFGYFSTPIFGFAEDTITRIIFEYSVGSEVRSVDEEVNLALSFEEPVNSVSLELEIDMSEPE